MSGVLFDFYAFFWDVLYKTPMPLRAIFIAALLLILLYNLIITFAPRLLKLIIHTLFLLLTLIIDYGVFLPLNKLITFFRSRFDKVPTVIRLLDKFFTYILNIFKVIDQAATALPAFIRRKKSPILVLTMVLTFLTAIILGLPYTKALKGTRIEKYTYAGVNVWNEFERKAAKNFGIFPTPVYDEKKAPLQTSLKSSSQSISSLIQEDLTVQK